MVDVFLCLAFDVLKVLLVRSPIELLNKYSFTKDNRA
jgi:hypothetical protein